MAITEDAGMVSMTDNNEVYVLFTKLGLHGVFKRKEVAEERGRLVFKKFGLDWHVENWELTDD